MRADVFKDFGRNDYYEGRVYLHSMTRKIGRKMISMILAVVLILLLCAPFYQSLIIKEKIAGNPPGWTDDIRISNNITLEWDDEPVISTNGNKLHIVWKNTQTGKQEIFYTNSTDSGETWSSFQQLSLGDPIDSKRPDMDTSGDNLYVVWDDTGGIATYEIRYINSTDGGITWSTPKMISVDDGFNSEGAKMAINNSNIHVIWVDSRHAFPNTEIYYNRSLDGGITWEGEQRLTNALFASAPSGIVVNGSNIHVVFVDDRTGTFGLYYIRSTDDGVTWDDGQGNIGDAQLISTNEVIDGAITVNGSAVHIVWMSQEPGPLYNLYYRNSTDNGFSWSSVQTLINSGTAGAPEITTNGNQINVVFQDFRDGGVSEVYYMNSTDAGISWNTKIRLTELDGNTSGAPKIEVNNSNYHIIWVDQRDSNWEVYYKRYPDFPTDTTPPTITHTPITEFPINQPINITANITDDFEVSNVTLYYENVGDTTYTSVDMVISDNWTATIPAQTETGLTHYFIWANDTSGNNATRPIIGDYAIQITGPPSIEVTYPIGGKDWTGGSSHQIEFIASDTEDAPAVLDVFLNYSYNSGAINGTIGNTTGNDSPYAWTLPTINATDVKVNATVVDSDGNKTYDVSPEFTIDSSPPEVILTNPVNNTTGISIFQPIVIQFNEKMNISSVVVNQTNGTNPSGWNWFWNVDKDTITGIHDGWLRGETIEITVQENYSDDSDPGNANNTAYVFSFATEINPSPEIVHTNISSPQELGDSIRINATITDDGEVMNAVLWWQGVDGIWHENYMDKNGDDWEYFIPGQMIEGKIKYQINATDDLGQKNTTIIYEFDIEDTTPPVIVHTPVENAVINEPINITCEVTDLGGVDVVYLNYKNETDTDFIQVEMKPGYWYEIPAYSNSNTIEYYLHAFDIYGNEAITQTYSMEILDPDTTPPEVLLATPTGDNIPISTSISIVFSEAMNQTSVEGAMSVSPDISFSCSWANDQTLVLSITGNLSFNTTYTVTIDTS